MSVDDVITRYIIENYGNLVLNESPEFDESAQVWISMLTSDYPIVIDEGIDDRRFHFLKARPLGYVVFSEDLKVIEEMSTSDEKVADNLTRYLDMWRSYAERLVVSASARNLANLVDVSNAFNPIYEIISYVLDNRTISKDDFLNDSRKKAKSPQYFELLREIEILRKENSHYTSGNLLASIIESAKNDFNTIINSVYAEILQKRYPYIRHVISTSSLNRVIKVENIVYYPEFYARGPVKRDRKTLVREFSLEYNDILTEPTLSGYLRKLESIGVIKRKGDLYSGVDSIRRKMFDLQKEYNPPDETWNIPAPV